MDDSHLFFLIVISLIIIFIGGVASQNSKNYHAAKDEERWINRLDRAIDKWNRLFAPDQSSRLILVHNAVYLTMVNTINQHIADQNFEHATFLLEDKMKEVKKHHKVLRAKHYDCIQFDFPNLDIKDGETIVTSLQENKPPYKVNLKDRICSCMTERETAYQYSDIRRICRHQVALMQEQNILPLFDTPYHQLILSEPYRNHFYQLLKIDSNELLIGYDAPLEWIAVWYIDKFNNHRFSFNILENRWSYGDSPRGLATKTKIEIKKALNLA